MRRRIAIALLLVAGLSALALMVMRIWIDQL